MQTTAVARKVRGWNTELTAVARKVRGDNTQVCNSTAQADMAVQNEMKKQQQKMQQSKDAQTIGNGGAYPQMYRSQQSLVCEGKRRW